MLLPKGAPPRRRGSESTAPPNLTRMTTRCLLPISEKYVGSVARIRGLPNSCTRQDKTGGRQPPHHLSRHCRKNAPLQISVSSCTSVTPLGFALIMGAIGVKDDICPSFTHPSLISHPAYKPDLLFDACNRKPLRQHHCMHQSFGGDSATTAFFPVTASLEGRLRVKDYPSPVIL